jgi:hypothetical protein
MTFFTIKSHNTRKDISINNFVKLKDISPEEKKKKPAYRRIVNYKIS